MTVDGLTAAIGYRLTDEQLAVVTAPLAPTLVVAGAGSGKTTVMAARVVWLVGTGQVAPGEVLGLTFTNKAAGELAARVRLMLRRAGLDHRVPPGPGADADLGEPTVSTYHAYAGRLLREHGLRIGVEPGARLLADATRFQLATRVVAGFDGPLPRQSAHLPTVVGDVLALDGELAEHLVELDDARAVDRATADAAQAWLDGAAELSGADRADTRTLRDTCLKRLELLDVVEALRAERTAQDVLDFSDQLRLAARLVRTAPAVVESERALHRVVLLDEYQDTSVAQRELLQTTFGAGHPVTAVGDPCQAIYGWRGASVHNIDAFPTDFPHADGRPATVHTLAVNNRSGDAVLQVANRLAAPLREVHPAVAPLRPRPDLVGTARVRTALHLSHGDEVAWVCDEIARQVHEDGRPPEDVAVLVRAGKEAVHYRDALLARDVPVEVVGLGGLLDVPEVADVVATLEVLDDPAANPALVRLLTGPRWRIGPRDLALLGRRAVALVRPPDAASGFDREQPADGDERLRAALVDAVADVDPAEVVSLCDAVEDPGGLPYSAAARERFAAFAAELQELRRHTAEPVVELVARIVRTTGLDVEVGARVHGDGGAALAQLAEEAAQFAEVGAQSGLHAFVAYLHAARRHDSGLEPPPVVAPSAVRLMTAHKAKGLEFPVVFVPALSAGVFPSTQARDVWTRQARCLPGRLRGDAADRPALAGLDRADHTAFKAAEKADSELEERRLAYVAATRAEQLLVLSGHWWGPTQSRVRGPSPYLLAAMDECARSDDPRLAVVLDTPEPEERTNPFVTEGQPVAWPAPPDPEQLARRRELAAAVGARAAVLRATGGGRPETPAGLTDEEAELVASWDRDAAALLTEARALADPRSDEVPVPSSLGATAALRLLRDPARVAAELVRPMPRPPAPAARRGTRFHEWVEEHVARRQLELADLTGPAPAVTGRRGDLDADGPEQLDGGSAEPFSVSLLGDADAARLDDAVLDELAEAFLAGPFADRVPYRVEAPFSLVVGGLVLRGRIDAVYAEPDGGWLVVDWKTGHGEPDPWQLALYRLAWAELVGVDVSRVRAAFYVVPTGVVDVPADLPDRAGIEAHLAAGPRG